MAYIGAQEVKAIREALKARFPEFKFGARKGAGGLSVDVTIKQGPVDFFADRKSDHGNQHCQINPYWLHEHWEGEARQFLEGVVEVIKTAPARKWYDNSDAMTDYFDTAYYFHINVGEWNKPYTLVK
jgi:hypothetical protein